MTGKDFAHIEAVADEGVQDERPFSHTFQMLMVGLVLVILMAALAVGFWLGRNQGVEIASSQDKARLQSLIQKQESELKNLRLVAKQQHKTDDVSMTQVGDLMFYNDLPKQSITPPALHLGSEKPTVSPQTLKIRDMIQQEMAQQPMLEKNKRQAVPPVSNIKRKDAHQTSPQKQHHYQVQLASFQKQLDARLFSKKLDGKGVKSRIQAVTLPKLGVWYRVYTGSYVNRNDAKQALLELKNQIHVTGLVVNQ